MPSKHAEPHASAPAAGGDAHASLMSAIAGGVKLHVLACSPLSLLETELPILHSTPTRRSIHTRRTRTPTATSSLPLQLAQSSGYSIDRSMNSLLIVFLQHVEKPALPQLNDMSASKKVRE